MANYSETINVAYANNYIESTNIDKVDDVRPIDNNGIGVKVLV